MFSKDILYKNRTDMLFSSPSHFYENINYNIFVYFKTLFDLKIKIHLLANIRFLSSLQIFDLFKNVMLYESTLADRTTLNDAKIKIIKILNKYD